MAMTTRGRHALKGGDVSRGKLSEFEQRIR